MRGNARKEERNKAVKTRLKTLEKKVAKAIQTGDKDQSRSALREATSALDKAVKYGAIHWATADRKKSRIHRRVASVQ